MHALTNLSPLDGRYANKVDDLRHIASEYGLIRYRLQVEVEWLICLSQHESIEQCSAMNPAEIETLRALVQNFSMEDAQAIKDIEARTNHDVKAVEYFLKQKLEAIPGLNKLTEFVHFACTSEDINNLAYALMLKDLKEHTLSKLQSLVANLNKLAEQTQSMAMLSLTHGQAATPTTLGKELRNVIARLNRQQKQLETQTILGKINGAVGNFNAHVVAYPKTNWIALSQGFVESFGLSFNPMTTQIEPHDGISEIFDNLARINTILIDFSRDVWGYISRGVFNQKLKDGEVGSSTMPHKVNPIDFENAEGNLGVANALLEHLARKLPISRYQRDLSDSTVLRNVGSCFGYMMIAFKALDMGIQKLEPNEAQMQRDLAQAWEVLAEPIQTVMRKHGLANPYETLKSLTRGQQIKQQDLQQFIETLDIAEEDKQILRQLTPMNYIGLASILK